jgi:MFS family permease
MILVTISGIVCGYGLAYTNNVIAVLNAVFGWETNSQQTINDSLYSAIFPLGAGVGATVAGKLVQYGRRNAHFIACAIGIVGVTI